MKATDFTYAGERLSDYGMMVAGFDSSNSVESINTDSQRTFGTVSMFYGKYQPFVYTLYENRLVIEFSIIKKMDCSNTSEEEYDPILSQTEIRSIKRWLNRPTPHKLSFDDEEYEDYYWEGSFNIAEQYFGGVPCGLSLTFESNRPFAIMDEVVFEGELEADGTFTINDTSDEEGWIYPSLSVTCLSAGDLQLENNMEEGRLTIVKNCEENETIMFAPNLQIRSSLGTHELGDDFNYKFLRIYNTYDQRENVITANLPISYTLKYNPIAKVVIA